MSNKSNKEEFYYCRNRKCPNKDCLRFYKNEPWNVMFYERMCKPNEDGICKDYINE